jgi:Trypsin
MAHTTTWARTAIAAAAICCCGVVTAASAAADPPDYDLSHHPVPALAPGVGIGIYNAAGQPADTCTAGWLVHDITGQSGLLTAGHCDDGGGATYFNKTTGFQIAGYFVHQAYEGDHGADADIAELGIANSPDVPPQVPTDTRIIGIRPVTAPADDTHLAKGQQLCHFGFITGPQHGGPECGPIIDVTPTKVQFLAHVEKGDSGGPVYYRNTDGTATPVGITIRAGDDDGGSTVAELIDPWLKRWSLSVDSS